VYLGDSGLACHLLGIDTAAELDKSPFRGVLFEGFIASEIGKSQSVRLPAGFHVAVGEQHVRRPSAVALARPER